MIGITVSITDANKHSLWDVITGVDTTGVSASKTYPGWKTGQTGSFHDTNLRAGSGNAGSIILGDGSVTSTDEGLLNGATQFYPGKMSILGLYVLAPSGSGGQTETVRFEAPMGGIG
jgi:hypothetical protein